MRLATRTSLAAAIAAALALALLGGIVRGQVYRVLVDRVDRQLELRADTAPLLAAVGGRLADSRLDAAVEGARITTVAGAAAGGQGTIEVGALPGDGLPPVRRVGWQTARADGQSWRLHTVEVSDVPRAGDRTLVQFVAPLGDIAVMARRLRRAVVVAAVAGVAASAVVGYGLGLVAARPLAKLRRDAARLGAGPPQAWRMAPHYGAPEVDDVARVLDDGLDRVAAAGERREAALDAARAFTASAAHELRTPLTSAITNLDVASHTGAPSEALEEGRAQLRRVASTLAALRQLADADLAGPAWFSGFDLADQVAVLADAEGRRHPEVLVEVVAPTEECPVLAWSEGVQLACANLIGNAVVHGRPVDGSRPRVRITVSVHGAAATITVDDNGPGVPPADRQRVLQRFERGATSPGSGIGLALVHQVATVHSGSLELHDSPLGGTRVVLTLAAVAPPPR